MSGTFLTATVRRIVWGPAAYGYYPALLYPGIDIGFDWGLGVDVGLYFGGWGGWGWGGWGWAPNWYGGGIILNHSFFPPLRVLPFFHAGNALGSSAWAHDPGHRLGVPYGNRRSGRPFWGGGQQAAKPGVVFTPRGRFQTRCSPWWPRRDSDHRDLSSAATPATTALSEAITGVGQPAWKAIMGFRASAVEDSAAAALAVEDFTAAGEAVMTNGNLTTYVAMVFALTAPALAQKRFDSAGCGCAGALIDSAENHDCFRLAAVLGTQGNAILTSGKVAQDRAEQSEFWKLASAKHQLIVDTRNSNRVILSIGEEDWPFPVPIVRSNGKWSFDASEAKGEMQARRIGAHELDAIQICTGYVEAQRKYASADHDAGGAFEYAAHMMGATDGHGGLVPLVPKGLADATSDGQKNALTPYHGYFFRILDGQGPHAPGGAHNFRVKNKLMGGFGLVAWPAQYGVDGNPHVHCESERRDLPEGYRPLCLGLRRSRSDATIRTRLGDP